MKSSSTYYFGCVFFWKWTLVAFTLDFSMVYFTLDFSMVYSIAVYSRRFIPHSVLSLPKKWKCRSKNHWIFVIEVIDSIHCIYWKFEWILWAWKSNELKRTVLMTNNMLCRTFKTESTLNNEFTLTQQIKIIYQCMIHVVNYT